MTPLSDIDLNRSERVVSGAGRRTAGVTAPAERRVELAGNLSASDLTTLTSEAPGLAAEAGPLSLGTVALPADSPGWPTADVPLRLPFFHPPEEKTVTQLARGAISLLEGANRATLTDALNAIRSATEAPRQPVTAARLMRHLERRVAIGEVLNKLARNWSQETVEDFATRAFTMESTKRDAMDAIVSLAILNDPNLERDLRAENVSEGTPEDFLGNRRIVWQHPPQGAPLEWPYVVLVAVDRQDYARRDEIVASIVSALEVYEGFKLPRAAVQQLR